MNFHQRKALRTKDYFDNYYKQKFMICIACDGTGKYDYNGSPDCQSCNGTGKVEYKTTTKIP